MTRFWTQPILYESHLNKVLMVRYNRLPVRIIDNSVLRSILIVLGLHLMCLLPVHLLAEQGDEFSEDSSDSNEDMEEVIVTTYGSDCGQCEVLISKIAILKQQERALASGLEIMRESRRRLANDQSPKNLMQAAYAHLENTKVARGIYTLPCQISQNWLKNLIAGSTVLILYLEGDKAGDSTLSGIVTRIGGKNGDYSLRDFIGEHRPSEEGLQSLGKEIDGVIVEFEALRSRIQTELNTVTCEFQDNVCNMELNRVKSLLTLTFSSETSSQQDIEELLDISNRKSDCKKVRPSFEDIAPVIGGDKLSIWPAVSAKLGKEEKTVQFQTGNRLGEDECLSLSWKISGEAPYDSEHKVANVANFYTISEDSNILLNVRINFKSNFGSLDETREKDSCRDDKWFIGIEIQGSRKSFGYTDKLNYQTTRESLVTPLVQHLFFGFMLPDGHLLTLGYRSQRSYTAPAIADVCTLQGNQLLSVCVESNIGPPLKSTEELLYTDVYLFFNKFQLTPRLTYNLSNDTYSISLPVYQRKEETKGPTGALKLEWRSDVRSTIPSLVFGIPL